MWNAPLVLSVGGRDGDCFVIRHSGFIICECSRASARASSFLSRDIFRCADWLRPGSALARSFPTRSLEPDNFLRVICEESELSHTQIEKNLCAEPVIAQVSCVSEFRVGLYGVESFLLQLVSVDFCRQPDTAALLSHIYQNALAFLFDLPQRGVHLISAIAPA